MEKSWWTYAYLVDWTIAIALSGAAVLLQVFHNSRPELDSTFVVDDQTVTIFGLYAITLIVPFVTIVLYQGFIVFWVHWIRRASEHRDVAMIHEIHNGFLGLTSGFGLTAIIIESIYMILAKVPNSACQGKSESANETGKVHVYITQSPFQQCQYRVVIHKHTALLGIDFGLHLTNQPRPDYSR
ncbi:hypothetical protein K7432_005475 [Basidiobolus ranarum]|uniref:Uncharacterized protein n=1 Tax=Basidiobolus ranarum TaxID=34480 RepID=A0ABR2WWF9_9FUNG